MRYENAFVPYGAYSTTPYCKRQGSYGHIHSMKLGAAAARDISPEDIDGLVLGMSVPQQSSFYGAPGWPR